jgi:hypothetical protein
MSNDDEFRSGDERHGDPAATLDRCRTLAQVVSEMGGAPIGGLTPMTVVEFVRLALLARKAENQPDAALETFVRRYIDAACGGSTARHFQIFRFGAGVRLVPLDDFGFAVVEAANEIAW